MKNITRKNKEAGKLRRVLGLVLVFEVMFGVVFFGLGVYGEKLGIIKKETDVRRRNKWSF